MIVLADASLERAAGAAAWGGLFNCGQVCVGVERVYVEAPVHDEFVELLAAKAAAAAGDVGAMATEAQTEIVERHVADAVKRGARVVTGGSRRSGGFEPTVLADVDHSMLVMREETFGPVIPVMRAADEDEAIALANDSDYGLSASVWCKSHRRGVALAERLEAGAVNVNDVFTNLFSPALPMAGWKESGLGAPRLGGDDAIRKYTRAQAVTVSRLTPAAELAWYPYSATKSAIAAAAVRLTAARGLRRRLPF
jgi:betaine-aldehyde dehydrogenase